RYAGEVLQNDPRRREGDLVRRAGGGVPVEQRLDVGAADVDAILVAQQILQQHLERVGQARQFFLWQRGEAPDLVGLIANLERRACPEAVVHGYLRVVPTIISGAPAACRIGGAEFQAAAESRSQRTSDSITAPPRQRSPS